MPKNIHPGDCVKLSDGRIARVRDVVKGTVRVRVRRKTSKTHQFLEIRGASLKKVACPAGWMSPAGYNRYLKVTLKKQKERQRNAASQLRLRCAGSSICMTDQSADDQTVTQVLPEKQQLPLKGLYLAHDLPKMSAALHKALVVTTFLTDRNGVIAKADEDQHFHVPRETRNTSDWRLSQELMAQADVLIAGGSYLKRRAAAGSHAQDILRQFEPGGEFQDLGDWRLRAGYPKRSPDLAVIARHLDFEIPPDVRSGGRRIVIFTTEALAASPEARAFTDAGIRVMGGGAAGVDARRMIDYLRDEMGARVIVMASGPRVLELLLQAERLDLLYLTRVQREIPFDDPSTVLTLLPGGKKVEDLKQFDLSRQYFQDHAVAGDGSPISQSFSRYDRIAA